MGLEKETELLKKIAKEYKTYGDLDNPEFEDTNKIAEAIGKVLNKLNELENETTNLKNYLSSQGMINDYIRWKRSKR